MKAQPQNSFAVVEVALFGIGGEDRNTVHLQEDSSYFIFVLVRELSTVEACAEHRGRNHPLPSFLETTHGVKAPQKRDAEIVPPWIVPAHHVSRESAIDSDGDLAMIEDPQEAVQLF